MSERGTFEGLINQVAILMAPLAGLRPATASVFLLELGLPIDKTKAAQLGGAMQQVSGSLASLLDLAIAIEQAIEDEAWGTVLEKAIAAADRIVKLIDGFAQLETALGGAGFSGEVLAAFPERLLGHLLAVYLCRSRLTSALLQLTGVLERVDHNVGVFDPATPFYTTDHFHFDRIAGWLTSPGEQLAELYDWGTPSFDGKKLLAALDRVLAESGVPVLFDAQATALDVLGLELTAQSGGLRLRPRRSFRKAAVELAQRNWSLTAGLESDVAADTEILVKPGSIAVTPPDATKLTGKISAAYSYKRPDGKPITLLSIAGGSEVTVEEITASIGVEVKSNGKAELVLGADLARGHVLITMENADGFLGTVLGGLKIENNFDLGVGVSTSEGVHFHGSSTLEIQLASHISLGPIELSALTLSVGIDEGTFPVGVTTDIKATLGPLVAIVEGIGFALVFALADDGNLGPIDLSAAFVPPTGVGLSLDVGVVKGGGYLFFDFDKEEYGGALQLDIAGVVSAKAIGIITTRMPDGSKGFSLLIIISVEFTPAFQLGYGFTLNGLGGMLGLHRAVDVDVLYEGLTTGAINSILFPVDVVANAPQIISDLRSIFPVEEGTFVVGPMAKLGWGTPTLISLAFGLVIEIPRERSVRIIILGALKIALPDAKTPLLNIELDFMGVLDFDKGMLSFDGALVNSFVLFMTLEGQMAVRFKWSEPAGFLISIGGFHPAFEPPVELEVKPMKRLAINILDYDWAKIRIEVYFALTSNSVQLGAHLELYFGFDGFYLDGHLGFDALFRFSPFYFETSIGGDLALHVLGLELLSIHLHFALSGPTPWHAWGSGSLTLICIEIEADFDVTWGDDANTTLPPIEVLPGLLAALDDVANWRALPPPSASGLFVTLASLEAPEGTLVLHPAGVLAVQQKLAPLDFTWERIGNQRPSDITRAVFIAAISDDQPLTLEPANDQFARAHYENLTDGEKLSAPSFESMPAGTRLGLGADVATGPAVTRAIDYEVVIIDKEEPQRRRLGLLRGLHHTFLAGSAVKRSPNSRAMKRQLVPRPDDAIAATGESFTVASATTNQPHSPAATFGSEAMARQYLARQLATEPNLALHVIPSSEVNAA